MTESSEAGTPSTPQSNDTNLTISATSEDISRPSHKWAMFAVLATLVLSNVMANEVIPSWAYVPWNLTIAAVLLLIAIQWDGRSADDIGLEPRKVQSGLRWGGAASALLLSIYLIGLAVPFTNRLFQDSRADISLGALAWETLIMVPLGTVLMEEVAFRGVLPAMFRKRFTRHANGALRADLLAALLFGFWHVLPSWNVNKVNPVFRDLLPGPLGQAAAITAGVLGTGAAGMALSWLRNRSDSLVAPVLMHCSSNSLGYLLSWIVQH
ncbi:MAG: CPBP family intramembrane glutamic endopeptidase [Actinomycetes bacterium]